MSNYSGINSAGVFSLTYQLSQSAVSPVLHRTTEQCPGRVWHCSYLLLYTAKARTAGTMLCTRLGLWRLEPSPAGWSRSLALNFQRLEALERLESSSLNPFSFLLFGRSISNSLHRNVVMTQNVGHVMNPTAFSKYLEQTIYGVLFNLDHCLQVTLLPKYTQLCLKLPITLKFLQACFLLPVYCIQKI